MPNKTSITEFILLELTDDPDLQILIFFFMFFMYLLSVSGNTTNIMLTLTNVSLKTPMYFFLRNSSLLEISFTTACIPRFLISIVTGDTTISYNAHLRQEFFLKSFWEPQSFSFWLLCPMIAMWLSAKLCITQVYMSIKVCNRLVISSSLAGFFVIFPPVIMGLQLDFCDSNIIDHFGCDSSPLLLISCKDTTFLELMAFFLAAFTLMVTLTLVIISYKHILRTILKFPSSQQREKAFFTCSSHIIVVSISYGICIFLYVKTSAKEGVALGKGVAILNTSTVPMLNPFIYTLRNQQVKQTLKDLIKKIILSKID